MTPSVQMVLIAALSFGSVAMLTQLGLSWWRRHQTGSARRLRGRITRMSRSDLADGAEDELGARSAGTGGIHQQLDALLTRSGMVSSVSLTLSQAGLAWSPARLMLISAGCALGGALFGMIAQMGLAAALICAVVGALGPFAYINRKRASRLRALERQLPDVLEVIGRALRSGYSFSGALKVVGEEMPDPIGPEFSRTQDEISFGIPVKDALQNLLSRVPSDNLRYMVVATLVQRETGGNLAEIFAKIARLMRERITLQGQIRVLSADGRISALILCLLPVVGALAMLYLNRPYISRLWESSEGHSLLMMSAVMMLTGIAWMRRVIQIRI
jgi:tight adherence protein B